MKNGALALVGTSVIPAFLTRSVLAEVTTAAANKKKLVVLFQRGACDGLNVVVPYQEKNYYSMRPSIAIKPEQVLDLNGFFGLHPSMAAFKPLYDQGHLAIVHAAGSPDTTRSHFDAQDYMESGTPGVKATPDGWLNRALLDEKLDGQAFGVSRGGAGDAGAADAAGQAAGDCDCEPCGLFGWRAEGRQTSPISNAFQAMYDESTDAVLHGTGEETFEAVKMLKAADPAHYQPAAGVIYPNTRVWQQPEAGCAVDEGEPGRGGGVLGHWRMGHAPEPGECEWAAGEPAEGVFGVRLRRSGRTWATMRRTLRW